MAEKTFELEFKILLEQDEDGYFVASVPELPGCHTQGKTLEEARKRIREAISLYLDVHPELQKEKIRAPRSLINFFATEDIRIQYA
ncbi:type II toxin-antitoxin system HicB family antitoxin [Candidatus Shapirobacteria bacterium]|nr:type II toxin-antitoxin system HicB family antitoxin [Candidatus Shapirobacteria bacterium]